MLKSSNPFAFIETTFVVVEVFVVVVVVVVVAGNCVRSGNNVNVLCVGDVRRDGEWSGPAGQRCLHSVSGF